MDARFFSHFINEQIDFAVESTGVPQLTAPRISKYPVAVPPLPEQRAIATALSDVDALIDSLDALIAKKRAIKTAAMQQLLTGRRRLPGFGTAWSVRPLSGLGQWLSGGTPSLANERYWSGDIPWVSPKDMKRPRLRDSADHISKEALNGGTRLAPRGALLIVVRGMILAHSFPVGRAERSFAFNQDIKALVPDQDVDSEFMLWWLQANRSTFLSITTESTHGTKRIPSEALFAQEVTLPSFPEQRAIATVLSDMDTEIAGLEARREKTRQVKQGMMQELLTGRTRLITPESEPARMVAEPSESYG